MRIRNVPASFNAFACVATAVVAAAVASIVAPRVARAQAPRPIAEQIAAATLPLPKALRNDAGVLGYKTKGKLELLRPAKNGMLCLANDPAGTNFHVACYAETLEPFMARGRQLRDAGTTGTQVDTVRFAEVKSGKLKMPTMPAALYQLTGPNGDFNPATGLAPKSKPSYVLYVPFATAASTGLSTTPDGMMPWIMYPGTPKAHIMMGGSM